MSTTMELCPSLANPISFRASRSFWIEKLKGLEPHQLHTDGAPSPCAPAWVRSSITGAALARLMQVTSGRPLLLCASLHAAWSLTFQRYSGCRNVVAASPSLNRGMHAEHPNSQLIPVILTPGKANNFEELLLLAREELVQAYRHGAHPVSELMGRPRMSIDDQAERFDVSIIIEGFHYMPRELANVTFKFSVEPHEVSCVAEFDGSKYSAKSISTLMGVMTRILDTGLRQHAVPLGALGTPAAFGQSHVIAPACIAPRSETSAVSAIWEHALSQPSGPALEIGERVVSYGELMARALSIAEYLRNRGAGPEVRIGVQANRSVETVAAVLGIQQAGAAYVPLDFRSGVQWVKAALAASQVSMFLSEEEVPAGETIQVIPLTQIPDCAFDLDRFAQPHPAQLAYVTQTSGSTGIPKSILVQHTALSSRVRAMTERYGISKSDRVLSFLPLTFDAAAEELYPVLRSGGTLVFAPDAKNCPASEIMPWSERKRITVLHLPTAYLERVVHEAVERGQMAPASVRLVMTGGESIRIGLVTKLLRDVAPRAEFVNAYGPSETTITATAWKIRGPLDKEDADRPAPIGSPLADTAIHLLDDELRPVPPGFPGEIYISGTGVSRGYSSAGSSAEAFLPCPFGEMGGRMYKTGDFGRLSPELSIEFLGRRDHQVKVRGFRLELSAVEAVARRCPEVRTAFPYIAGTGGDRRLALAVGAPSSITSAAVRNYLSAHMPGYMLPSEIVVLPDLPLRSNGKVDCAALDEMIREERHCSGAAMIEPRNEIELQIANAWKEILGMQCVSVDTNFFEAGGTSMLLMQVHSKLQAAGFDFALLRMFEYPTIASLAAFLPSLSDQETKGLR